MIGEKIAERIDEIDSFDSAFNEINWKNDILIIPYLNLGVSLHPLNETKQLKYLNFSYIVCLNVSYLAGWSEDKRQDVILRDGVKKEPIYYFGGENIGDRYSVFNDFKICCAYIYLQTLDITELSDTIWEIGSGFMKQKISDFWSGKYMPAEIKNLIR